jgi:FKBP-type peptidyl-prolyl cis-trans isomerase
MKLNCLAILVIGLATAQANAADAGGLKTEKDKLNYGIGVDIARNIKRQGVDVEVEALLKGMRDALTGNQLLMTEPELRSALAVFQADQKKRMMQARLTPNRIAQLNIEEGDTFLATNKTRPGVVTLSSGLQYQILRAGQGRKPKVTDTVECHFRGTLINGTEFDESYRRGNPIVLRVSEAMPGWKEALLLMAVGSKWQLFIPTALAYGAQGSANPPVGPNATLLFELELLAIK